ncbi:hypothetical protein [Lacrimispora sp.]|uniref:hypothetical protein n=1 Tax=Lacrimispora sp. TaxID=2719234 RepID=UPI002F3F2E10
MGHLGFSYVGLIFLLMLMIPNLIWTRYQPEGYDSQGENKVLLIFERAGRGRIIACCRILSSESIWEGSLAFDIHGNFRNRAYWHSSAASQGKGR